MVSILAQIVEPGLDNCRMRMVDLTSKAHNGDAACALGAWVERESIVPFEPYRTPPVRAYLARLAEDDHAVLILMHHVRPPLDAAPVPARPSPLPLVQAPCEPVAPALLRRCANLGLDTRHAVGVLLSPGSM